MKYKKVVVAGGGILGSQIAFQTAYTGFDVTVLIREDDSKEEEVVEEAAPQQNNNNVQFKSHHNKKHKK